ncbi:TetR/AcrR family transcriptional regulator [Pseudomonas sp. LRF_L74]|uniref:TetR/AcrR family transcriptional regulator n=1 Tax=Pseudomonas sp. LRF_L74 TaxID=3369422 RepID=UPI003F5FC675
MPRASRPASASARLPQQARGQARVDAVLDACAQLLARHGEAALTMHGLAQAAGTSIGSLYHFFADKQNVLQALGERHLLALREVVTQTDAISDQAWQAFTPGQLANQLLTPYLDYFTRHPDFLHLIRRVPGQATASTTDQALEARIHGLFLRVVCLRLPMASPEQQQAYAATLFSLPVGMLTQQLLEYDSALRERILREEIPRALEAYIGAIELIG